MLCERFKARSRLEVRLLSEIQVSQSYSPALRGRSIHAYGVETMVLTILPRASEVLPLRLSESLSYESRSEAVLVLVGPGFTSALTRETYFQDLFRIHPCFSTLGKYDNPVLIYLSLVETPTAR